MSSSESETSVAKSKMIRSVIKVKDPNWEAQENTRDDSDYDSDNDKENQERDWRKRKTIHSKDNSSYIEYTSNKDESDPERRERRYKERESSNKRRRERERKSSDSDSDNERRRKQRKERRRKTPSVSPPKQTDTQIEEQNKEKEEEKKEPKKKTIEDILTKAGGAYIPPSKLRQMQEGITDKTSVAYQRMAWEALKKSINGLVNKVNVSNIGFIVEELLQENVIRGRGLVCQSIMRAQVASPTFTNVYAALVSIINTKFPKIGELLLRRLIIQFRRSFKRNDKAVCINTVKFIAHLVNQQVAHELISLEVLTLLLQNPSGDSVEVAISFLKEVGQKLTEISPRGINAVFESLRRILHDSATEKRVQYMIEVVFAIRKDGFKDYPSVMQDLDLVEEDDQITHILRIDDKGTSEDLLNVFKHDPSYEENEEKYKQIKSDILGGDDSEDDGSEKDSDEDESDDDDDDDNDEETQEGKTGESMEIIDKTETNMVALRRLIYLTIQSSLDYEECAHKMMKLNIKPGQEHEFCFMVLECCAQQRSYEKFFGLLGQRFCLLKKEFMEQYVIIFKEQYDNCHQLETNKLRNTAKFFGHLMHSDAISWTVMECIRLNEDDTTSSSRIFIKVLFQDLAEYIGVQKLRKRLNDPIVAPYLEGVFPRDNPRDTRFSINFFTAVGLGGLTEELRAHLKTMPKTNVLAAQQQAAEASSSSSSSSSSSDDSSSSSSSSSEDSDSSDGNQKLRKKKRESERPRRRSDERPNERKEERRRSDKHQSRERSRDRHDTKQRRSPNERRRRSPDAQREISKDKKRSSDERRRRSVDSRNDHRQHSERSHKDSSRRDRR